MHFADRLTLSDQWVASAGRLRIVAEGSSGVFTAFCGNYVMNIYAVTSKSILAVSILLTVSLSVSAKRTHASELDSVCQLNIPNGYCQLISPSVKMTTLPSITPATSNAAEFGTFKKPFSVTSLWNSRPRQVAFGSVVIPTSSYYPLVGTGSYSTIAFLASSTDSAVTVYPADGKPGVWDPDSEAYYPSITIPHWPSETVPATGTDGHADIVDVEKGVIHSFFQLKNTNGRWTATQYAWASLKDRGWGDGAHYFQGARAAGIPSMAGLIRKHEINDGAPQFYHALAMSLTYNGMSNIEQYVYPATSGDYGWKQNYGFIPMGALMMLPPSFDANSIADPDLRKVVNTLKTFGAYVVDRNVGTPFYIYVENGSNYTLHKGGWNSVVAKDLHRIREAMRQVTHAKDWVDALGNPIASLPAANLASMRGPWRTRTSGGQIPRFDSYSQNLVFTNTSKVESAENASGRVISGVKWAKPVKGKLYEFRVEATNGGRAYLRFWGGGKEQFNTRALGNGQTFRFHWPTVDGTPIMGAVSGIGAKTEVRGILTQVNE